MNDVSDGQGTTPPLSPEAAEELGPVGFRRDRLLASLNLLFGLLLLLAAPFALRFGAEFFLPTTAALVIAIALVPLLEWMERRHVPSVLAAIICVLVLIVVANAAIASILIPAMQWVQELPSRIETIRETLAPIFEWFAELEQFFNNMAEQFARTELPGTQQTVTVQPPGSTLEMIASSAPHAVLQLLFALLVIFFFLAGWTRMRKRTITGRTSFDGAMTTARVIQKVVDATSLYLGTITMVNISVGLIVAAILWSIDMPTPLMWGGIVALLNFIPYLGAIGSVLLLGMGGLMVYPDPWMAAVPALSFFLIHIIEANIVTPTLVGRRLTINPLLILIALSFWAWVWGTAGALLAVPLLIIGKTILDAAGRPDIAGFLFEDGTLIEKANRKRE